MQHFITFISIETQPRLESVRPSAANTQTPQEHRRRRTPSKPSAAKKQIRREGTGVSIHPSGNDGDATSGCFPSFCPPPPFCERTAMIAVASVCCKSVCLRGHLLGACWYNYAANLVVCLGCRVGVVQRQGRSYLYTHIKMLLLSQYSLFVCLLVLLFHNVCVACLFEAILSRYRSCCRCCSGVLCQRSTQSTDQSNILNSKAETAAALSIVFVC